MKNLKDILKGITLASVKGTTDLHVETLVFDSRNASNNTVFFAIKGATVDGHDYIPSVIEKGCQIIVTEKEIEVPENITLIVTDNSSKALAIMATNFNENPSSKLKLIGITGTNGKTTTTTLLFNLFTKLGYKCGLLSTVVNKIGATDIPATHTTPNPVALNVLLHQMVEEGCTHCFMEVSSHAIHQHRITGLHFEGGVFTNITHDHLDYHKTFQEYIKVKKSFFDNLSETSFALVNVDDKNGSVMLQNTKAKKYTFALKSPADFKVKVMENQFSGLVLNLCGTEVWSRLIGDFNAYNLVTVYAVAELLGEDKMEILTLLSNLESVEGRFQYITSEKGITAIVDYAHTPDALENVLKTIENIRTKNETVYTVVGCGGDRDKAKRPKMAAIACEMSDKVIITSDNPRSEDPKVIIEEMMEGVEGLYYKKTLSIEDREQAIKTAVSMAEKGDIILIAGKGHEKYQEIKGVKLHFDDMETVNNLFKKLEK
ncbi:MAG: UDP-N-acetylmuramoyl-L-alanyl-D-glutamate--2,6-diaminopimelate ligase [Flavobacteriia bacterium]|nr:UDP-N-acetylmuramoyl-L-alanyl-D-glutamate--2,6-diaminopimelate ligase [Flavobacteriia bacterium]